jgi:hypothetical protein
MSLWIYEFWNGHKLSRQMPLLNWQRLQEADLTTLEHAVNSVSGLALDFCHGLALDFGLDNI